MARVAFDEMTGLESGGLGPATVREAYGQLKAWLDATPPEHFNTRRSQAELLFRRIGITFAVYGDNESAERLIPFDIIPRVLTSPNGRCSKRGLKQRVTALNAFLERHLRARRNASRPASSRPTSSTAMPISGRRWRPSRAARHLRPHRRDRHRAHRRERLLRARGQCPHAVRRLLHAGEPRGDDAACSRSCSPATGSRRSRTTPTRCWRRCARSRRVPRARDPTVVLLTPGRYNSAYYEHSFLADKLGVELVEGSDLFVEDDVVYMRTTEGPRRVDVIYRRIDDDFLDPWSSGRIRCSACPA